MRNRPIVTLLCIGMLLVQILPPWSWTEAAAQNAFTIQQSRIVGRQEVPSPVDGVTSNTPAPIDADPAARLAALQARWSAAQQVVHPLPQVTMPMQLALPLVTNFSPAPLAQSDQLQEVVDLRTANSATYIRPDGLLETRVYLQPIHYLSHGQQWQQYDPI